MKLRILCSIALGLLVAGCGGDTAGVVFGQEALVPGTLEWFSLRPGATLDLVSEGKTAEGIDQPLQEDPGLAFGHATSDAQIVGEALNLGDRLPALPQMGARSTVAVPLLGALGGLPSFARSEATDCELYDFNVFGTGSETVLQSHVCGTVSLKGFLLLVAGGEVGVSLDLKLFDLGTRSTPHPPKIVHSLNLANHSMTSVAISPNIAATVKLEAGAPYIGLGGGFDLGINIDLQQKIVSDNVDFGFDVLLKRGHRYRLQFELSTLCQGGVLAGPGVAQFLRIGEGTGLVTTFFKKLIEGSGLLERECWEGAMTALLDVKLPDITPTDLLDLIDPANLPALEFPRIALTHDFGDFIGSVDITLFKARTLDLKSLIPPFIQDDLANLRRFIDKFLEDNPDVAGSFADIITKRFTAPLNKIGDDLKNLLLLPGAHVKELSVTMQNDVVEEIGRLIRSK